MSLRFQVSDLLAHSGRARHESAATHVDTSLVGAVIDDEAEVEVDLRSLSDGIVVRGRAVAPVDLTCRRCLKEWTEPLEVGLEAVFRIHPDDEDEELPVTDGGWIDLGPLVHDELSLALPDRPLCRPECLGLCSTCGADLNDDPCGGHGDESDSPFAALRDVFGSEET